MAGDGLPLCVIVTGRPGSGKSTLAPRLAESLRMPLVSRDAIKEGYVVTAGRAHADLPADTNLVVSRLFGDVVHRLLDAGVSVVIEAAFQHRGWAGPLESLRAISRPRIVLCTLPPEHAAERFRARATRDPAREWFHGPGQADAEYVEPAFDVPTLRVDTRDGCRPSIEALARWLRSQPENR